jgi:outer membrane biosynthesis protein TonB
MQFQVPQFIETEDKIIGPFSLRQFAFVGVGGVLSAICYFALATWLWVIVSLFIFSISLSLAFVKIEGRPFAQVIVSAFNFYWKPQTYVWQPEHPTVALPAKKMHEEAEGSALEDILAKSTPHARPRTRTKAVFSAPVQAPPVSVAKVAPPVISPPAQKPAPIVTQPVAPAQPEPIKLTEQPKPAAQPAMKAPPQPEPEPKPEPAKPITRESVKAGVALHKSWEQVQTNAVQKNSDKQFLERKMAERYQIFQRPAGDRRAAKRVDYR